MTAPLRVPRPALSPALSLGQFAMAAFFAAACVRCSDSSDGGTPPATGGAPATGGSATGGAPVTGGSATGGSTSGGSAGGSPAQGGKAASGGSVGGGAANGGAANGGTTSGGTANGGSAGASGASGAGSGGVTGGSGGGSAADGCAGKQYLLCESFETTAEGAIPTGWTKNGTIAVAADQAARGKQSLKVGNAESGERRIRRSVTFGSNHWGRLFYRVQLPVPAVNPDKNSGNTVIHSTLVGLNADRPTGGGTAEYRVLDTIMNTSKKHNYIYNVQTSNAGEFGHETAYTYDYKDSWVCAEWHVDNMAKSYALYIDGVEIPSVAVNNDQPRGEIPTSFLEMRVGWYNYQAGDGGFTAWIDEVAVNATRVGCD